MLIRPELPVVQDPDCELEDLTIHPYSDFNAMISKETLIFPETWLVTKV